MTTQLRTVRHGTSKAVLQENLNTAPAAVIFETPKPWGSDVFTGADIPVPSSFACVLDPATRRRFATVKRKADGTFKVE